MLFGRRVLALASIVVVCNVKNEGVAGQTLASAAVIAELTRLATQYGAPFGQTASERLHSEVFGSETATRSTDVIIFNKSSKTFKLNKNECEHGGYALNLFPEHEIASKQSSVFLMTSHGFLTGVECTTRYQSSDGLFVRFVAGNPCTGKNWMSHTSSSSLEITSTRSTGNNNQVRWIIEDRDIPNVQKLHYTKGI